jgi:hypothetical protein
MLSGAIIADLAEHSASLTGTGTGTGTIGMVLSLGENRQQHDKHHDEIKLSRGLPTGSK